MWWLGLCPNRHIYGSLLRARGLFMTLLDRGQHLGLLGHPSLLGVLRNLS